MTNFIFKSAALTALLATLMASAASAQSAQRGPASKSPASFPILELERPVTTDMSMEEEDEFVGYTPIQRGWHSSNQSSIPVTQSGDMDEEDDYFGYTPIDRGWQQNMYAQKGAKDKKPKPTPKPKPRPTPGITNGISALIAVTQIKAQ